MLDEEKNIGEERERVNSSQEQSLVESDAHQSIDDRDPNKDTRPPRVTMSNSVKLTFPEVIFERDKYHYYAFVDHPERPGRIESAKAAYWEHVTNKEGHPITQPAGGGTHYLMKLPLEYWREDLMLKKKKVARTMASQDKLGPNEYAPDPKTGKAEGGTSIYQERHTSDNPYS